MADLGPGLVPWWQSGTMMCILRGGPMAFFSSPDKSQACNSPTAVSPGAQKPRRTGVKCIKAQGPWPGDSKDSGPGLCLKAYLPKQWVDQEIG